MYIAKNGGVRGHSWISQTLSDAWESMNLEDWFGDPGRMMTGSHTMITETKLARREQVVIPDLKLTKKERYLSCQELWSRNLERLNVGDSTFCQLILKHADTWKIVWDMRCLRLKEKRLNSESESERLSRESWREKPGGNHARTQSLRESVFERREDLELSEVQGMCLRNSGINMMSRWRFDMRTHLAVTS